MECEDVYTALSRSDWQMVRNFCQKHPEGPFLPLTKRRESVLQKALYSTQVDLALDLFSDAKKRWPPREFEKKLVMDVTTRKKTILHVAATHDACIPFVEMMFESTNQLLFYDNDNRETPIFSAVRYGQLKMFKFLNRRLMEAVPAEEDRLSMYKLSNKSTVGHTVLHVAISNEHFELALYIATTIPSLICEQDRDKLTGLHLLAMKPAAFRTRDWKWLELLFPCYFRRLAVEILEDGPELDLEDVAGYTVTLPWWDRIKKAYQRYQAALQLGIILIKEDRNWIHKPATTRRSTIDIDDDVDPEGYTDSASAVNLKNADVVYNSARAYNNTGFNITSAPGDATAEESAKPPTPLVLATMYGCLDIAIWIIRQYPQSVEQAGCEGSILHLAIKYRRIEIFEAVMNMRMQMRGLVRRKDHEGNSILHMVALNTTKVKVQSGTDAASTDNPKGKLLHPWDAEVPHNETRSPAFELQEDLLWFERVENILKTNYHILPNKAFQTAEQLFATKKEALRESAQEYMKRAAENWAINCVLIATVAFAAAYTVPGGTDDHNGSPILLNQTLYVLFTVTDVLSLASTLIAVFVFLSILTSSFRFQDFKKSLPMRLMFGIACLTFSLTMLTLAFAATIILMIKDSQQHTRIALYAVAFLPVGVLIATYLLFSVPLMQTYYDSVDKVKEMLPRFQVGKASVSKTKRLKTWSDLSIQV